MSENNRTSSASGSGDGEQPVRPAGPPPAYVPGSQTGQYPSMPNAPVGPPPAAQPDWMISAPLQRKRSGGKLALVIGAVVVALVLAGAVTTVLVMNHRADVAAQERQAAAERKAEAERQAAEEAKREAEEKKAAELAAARAKFTSCTDQLGQLLNVLNNVDSRLDVGLSQRELSNMIGKASIAYDHIDIKALGNGACLTAGARLESAFNNYAATVRDWNDCIYDLYCDVDDDILTGMQTRWAKAATLISRAETLLDSMDPDSAAYDSGAVGDNA